MKTYKNAIFLLRNCCFAAMLLALGGTAQAQEAAPDFTLKSIDHGNIRLAEYRGQVVLLNFWASWCGPCRKEMPLLNDLHNRYQKAGFSVLGVNVEQDSSLAKSYLNDTPVDFPILLDDKNQVSELYQVIAMPSSAVIDRDGKIRYQHKGYQDGDEDQYRKVIKQLIRE